MPNTGHVQEIARASNGVVTPRYTDRQVLRAEDLTLGRVGHDAELARSRRYLYGWGIVNGLVPIVQDTDGTGPRLSVSPGYGVTPSGEELYLPAILVVDDDIVTLVRDLCGPGSCTCESELGCECEPADGAPEPSDVTTVWLVARPVHDASDLRAGHPAGCAHPASALAPARECEGVALELLCTDPDADKPPAMQCPELTAFLWAEKGAVPTPVPPDLGEGDDHLVLARLDVTSEGTVDVHHGGRRRLLPAWLIQDWVLSCLPAMRAAPAPAPSPDDPEEPPAEDRTLFVEGTGGHVIGIRTSYVHEVAWPDLEDKLKLLARGGPRRPGVPSLPRPLEDPDTIAALETAGLTGPRAFLAAEAAEVAAVTGLDVDTVDEIQTQLAALSALFGRGTR